MFRSKEHYHTRILRTLAFVNGDYIGQDERIPQVMKRNYSSCMVVELYDCSPFVERFDASNIAVSVAFDDIVLVSITRSFGFKT